MNVNKPMSDDPIFREITQNWEGELVNYLEEQINDTDLYVKLAMELPKEIKKLLKEAKAEGKAEAWDKFKAFIEDPGILVYDGSGNLLKVDDKKMIFKSADQLLKEGIDKTK